MNKTYKLESEGSLAPRDSVSPFAHCVIPVTAGITLARITGREDPRFGDLLKLWFNSFPAEERRETKEMMKLITEEEDYHFNSIEYEDGSVGLLSYWDLKTFFYLEYFTIHPDHRNSGLGKIVLDCIAECLPGVRLLEAEPIEDELTGRRIRFYERNGYRVLLRDDRVLLEARGGVPPLWILGNQSLESLDEYIKIIRDKVYLGKSL